MILGNPACCVIRPKVPRPNRLSGFRNFGVFVAFSSSRRKLARVFSVIGMFFRIATSVLYCGAILQFSVLGAFPTVKGSAWVKAAILNELFSRSVVLPDVHGSIPGTMFGRCIPPRVPALLLFCHNAAGIPVWIEITGLMFQPPKIRSATGPVAHGFPLPNGRSQRGAIVIRWRTSLIESPYSPLRL